MTRLEALADGIAHYSGMHDPESAAYQNRNPGALKAYLPEQRKDERGMRVFRTLLDGYQAFYFDLSVKCSGKSHTKLRSTSTLRDLILAYGHPITMAKYVANFLKKALRDESLNDQTPLGYFVENDNGR